MQGNTACHNTERARKMHTWNQT